MHPISVSQQTGRTALESQPGSIGDPKCAIARGMIEQTQNERRAPDAKSSLVRQVETV